MSNSPEEVDRCVLCSGVISRPFRAHKACVVAAQQRLAAGAREVDDRIARLDELAEALERCIRWAGVMELLCALTIHATEGPPPPGRYRWSLWRSAAVGQES